MPWTSHTHRHPTAESTSESALPDVLLRVVDGALAAILFVVPWCMGGRHPLGELVLVTLTLVAAVGWLARQCLLKQSQSWSRSPAEWLILAAIGLVSLQLIPLPAPLHSVLSPRMRQLLPLWQPNAVGALGVWNQVSVTPAATQSGLILLLAYGLLFLTIVQRVRRVDDVEQILRWVAISVSITATFGLIQYLTSNGKFLWVYQHPFRYTDRAVSGMFINKNHFAHLLALGIGPLVWCLARSLQPRVSTRETFGQRDDRSWLLWLLALTITLFAGLMSLSRGGVAMIALAACVSAGALAWRGLLSRKFASCGALLAVLLGCGLAVHGYEAVAARLDDYAAGSLERMDRDHGRRSIWQTDLRALRDYFVLGAGVGSHREVYPTYMAESFETEFTHAESGYLQIALETGLPGLALAVSAILWMAIYCGRGLQVTVPSRSAACAAAIVASLTVSIVHALVDFAWYVPACMATTLALGACLVRLRYFEPGFNTARAVTARDVAVPRWLSGTACAALLLFAAWAIPLGLRATVAAWHWDAYLEFAFSAKGRSGEALPGPEVMEHLRQVCAWTPGDPRAHLRLAASTLRYFERLQAASSNAMPLNQIRDAAVASQFASRKALDDWLSRAVGAHRHGLDLALWHTRRALACCPLEGEAYTYLVELCFLEGAANGARGPLLEQALRVRPYHGGVLLSAGSEAALAGDLPRALEFWRRALEAGPQTQRQLVELLAASQMPLDVIVQTLRPDLASVRLFNARYTPLVPAEQMRPLLVHYLTVGQAAANEQPPAEAATTWLELHDVYRRLGQPEQELHALALASALAPNDFAVRRALAAALFRYERFADAEPHLRWCLERRPDDEQLKAFLTTVVKQRAGAAQASAGSRTWSAQ